MKKYLIALSLVGLVTTSCYEKLNIAPPNAITNEQVQKLLETADDETVVNIMGAMADGLNGQFKSTTSLNGWSNDDFSWTQALEVQRGFSGNDIVISNAAPTGTDLLMYNFTSIRTADAFQNEPFWLCGYNLVHAANKVFNLLTDELIAKNGNAKLKEFQGRAYLTRAYGYLFLMESYGTDELGVPIYTRYSLNQDIQPRSTTAATFDSIIKWANKAVSLFEDSKAVSYNHNVTGDLNLGVANFVLARAALWKQDWSTVISACDKLIANYPLMNEQQYVARNKPGESGEKYVYYAEGRGFTDVKSNPECILGWNNANKGAFSADYWLNFMRSGKQARIDDRLYNKIAAADYRKDNFQVAAFGKFIAPSKNGFAVDGSEYDIGSYINLKFAANVGVGGKVGNTDACTPNVIDYALFRVSEAYLMKAEAQVQSGGDWKTTLNSLISARSNGALNCDNYPSMAGLSPLEMVQLQTRIEMWGEHSLEFYNNRRWKINVDRSGSSVHHSASQIPYTQLVIQIPEQEINTNNLIVQNQ